MIVRKRVLLLTILIPAILFGIFSSNIVSKNTRVPITFREFTGKQVAFSVWQMPDGEVRTSKISQAQYDDFAIKNKGVGEVAGRPSPAANFIMTAGGIPALDTVDGWAHIGDAYETHDPKLGDVLAIAVDENIDWAYQTSVAEDPGKNKHSLVGGLNIESSGNRVYLKKGEYNKSDLSKIDTSLRGVKISNGFLDIPKGIATTVARHLSYEVPNHHSVTFDAATSAVINNNTTSVTFAHTVANQPNRYIGAITSYALTTISTITYAGSSLSSRLNAGSLRRIDLYDRVAPSTGSNNVVVTMAGTGYVVAGVISAYGVDPNTPVSSSNTASAATSNPSSSVSSNTDELVISGIVFPTSSNTMDASWTSAWNRDEGSGVNYTSVAYKSGASPTVSRTDTWTTEGSSWAMVIASLLASTTPSTPTVFVNDTFTGVDSTLLENHTGETGAVWNKHTNFGSASLALTASSKLRNNSASAQSLYYASGVPSTADYDVQADFHYLSSVNADQSFGLMGRVSTAASTYYWAIYNEGDWCLYKSVAGTVTFLASTTSAITPGQIYSLKLSMRGTSITVYVNGVSMASATDSSVTAAGRSGIGLYKTGTADGVGVYADNFKVTDVGVLDSGVLSQAVAGTTSVALMWKDASGGTKPYSYQVQRAVDSAGTPGSYSNIGSPQSTLSYTDYSITTTNSYWYRVTVNDSGGSTSSTTNAIFVPMASRTSVTVNNPNIYFTPQNWYISGSSFARANNSGPYFKVGFTGTSVILNADTSATSSYPIIAYSIDGAALQRTSVSTTSISLSATPLASGSHDLVVYVDSIGQSDRWTPTNQFKLTGISLDSGASVASSTSLKTSRMLIYGDSHTEGSAQMGASQVTDNLRWTTTWNKLLADALNAEISAIPFQGQGFTRGVPDDTVPVLSSTYNFQSSGISRTFTPEPDYVFLAEGANDFGSLGSVQAAETTMLSNLRSAMPTAVIFVVVPLNQTAKTQVTAAFNAQSDPRTFLIDLGTAGANIITSNTYDNSHPNTTGHSLLEASFYTAVNPIIPVPVTSAVASTTGISTSTITWTTDRNSDTLVEYGLTTTYTSSSTYTSTKVKSHSVAITGLTANTLYHFRTRSVDDTGKIGTSSDRTFTTTSDTTAPTVSLTAPSASATVSGSSVNVSASASDFVGVSGVRFKLDTNTNIGSEDVSSPYSVTWDSTGASSGSHTLIAVARDAAGNYATSTAVTITVDNAGPVISSIASSTSATTATVTWTTDESSNSKVSYGTVSGTYTISTTSASSVTSHSVGLTGLSGSTQYYYVVVSMDAYSNFSTSSEKTLLTGDTTVPTVSMTAPSASATVSGSSVTVSATASDDVAVSGVQFKLDTNTAIGLEDTSSPYSVTWDSTGVSDGSHTIIAVARDSSGNYATSSAVTVTVSNSSVSASTPVSPNPVFVGSTGGGSSSYAVAPIKYKEPVTIPVETYVPSGSDIKVTVDPVKNNIESIPDAQEQEVSEPKNSKPTDSVSVPDVTVVVSDEKPSNFFSYLVGKTYDFFSGLLSSIFKLFSF